MPCARFRGLHSRGEVAAHPLLTHQTAPTDLTKERRYDEELFLMDTTRAVVPLLCFHSTYCLRERGAPTSGEPAPLHRPVMVRGTVRPRPVR